MKSFLKFGLMGALLIGGASFVYAQSDTENAEAAAEESTEAAAETAGEEAVAEAAEEAVEEVATEGEALEAEVEEETMIPATDKQLKEVVAKVDGEKITLGDVLIVKADTPEQFLQGSDEEVIQNLVRQIAVQRILSKQAKDSKVLDLRIANVTHSTRAQVALEDYVEANLTDEFIQQKYDEIIGNQPEQTEWNAAHILVESEEEAVAVKARLDEGEDFAEVAKEVSKDPGSGANGGELGWFGPGQMVPAFEEATKGLDTGAVSGPVQSDFGWHIIRLNETRIAEKPSFEEVEPQLRDYAQSELVNGYVESIQNEAEIEPSEDFNIADFNLVLPQE